MIEKIKKLDLVNMNEEDSSDLLNELMELSEEEFANCIIIIFDRINFNFFEVGLNTTKMNNFINSSTGFYKFIFDCDAFKRIMKQMNKVISN